MFSSPDCKFVGLTKYVNGISLLQLDIDAIDSWSSENEINLT